MKIKVDNFFSMFFKKACRVFEKAVCAVINLPEYSLVKNTICIPLLLQQRFHQQQSHNQSSTKVAIFFDLEYSTRSAIAEFSIKTFCPLPDKFHIFTKFSNAIRAKEVLQEIADLLTIDEKNICVFDAHQYEEMDKQFNYAANIFVLGNSLFNLNSLHFAISMHQHRKRNILHFHDGIYIDLLFSWIVKHGYSWKEFVTYYYPKFNTNLGLSTVDIFKQNIHMLHPLIELTGCSRVLINAENCLPILENEVDIDRINCIKGYLPIPDYRHITPFSYRSDNDFIVAHFGIPSAYKHISILIKAVGFLRQQHKVKLLLAGYGVAAYVKNLPKSEQQFIIFEESPNSQRLLSLMKGADIAVQLRWPCMGQASGVVSEMLGLGLKCITTKGFVNECFKDYVVELPACISPEQLAEAILNNRGKMRIPAEEYRKLLDNFSCAAFANLVFDSATNKPIDNIENIDNKNNKDKVVTITDQTQPIKLNRKLRILYGASHRILRFEEVPLFIAAGFEVIPVKAHWEVFNIQEPGADNPTHPLYPNWRDTCSIPEDVLEKIQAIDILKYQNLNTQSGIVSENEAALLNEWIDIIYIPNLLPTVPRVLSWFRGLTLFRVYGEGKIMTYDEWAKNSGANLSLLRKYDMRYATMLMLHALNGPEHASILGSNVFHVGPCVTKSRIIGKWKAEAGAKICNTALSYIYENPHWTDIYHTFCELFNDIPLRILGKNNKKHKTLKYDERVVGLVKNDEEYLKLLTDCRCLLDPGTSPFHTHYTPLEAIMMGIPVIFLENSGMACEIFRVIPESELTDSGICKDFIEAKEVIKRCLDDIEYAKAISAKQKIIAEKMFSPHSVLQQIKQFAAAAPALVEKGRTVSYPVEIETISTGMVTNKQSAGLAKEGFLQKLNILTKFIIKNVIILFLNITRLLYKIVCPSKYHEQASGFLFKSSFPRTYENMQELRQQMSQEYD